MGYFLVFGVPVWMIGTAASAGAEDRAPIEDWHGKSEVFRPFARFPQGFPPGLDDYLRPIAPPETPEPPAPPPAPPSPPAPPAPPAETPGT
jgi:hypothetical protein